MNPQADVVKKSYLKFKVVRVTKSSSGAGVQGPKAFKELWFVFRALDGGEKILEYHQNERKFRDSPAYPKGVLHLKNAVAVSYHNPEKKQQFSIEMADTTVCFFEAGNPQLAHDWLTCLNAVLFGRGTGPNGTLQYFVEVTEPGRLQYVGSCMIEVKGEDLIVKTKEGTANLVRWKLAHIRSFKAKRDTLTIYSGTRSSTGVGEYYFKSPQSVQITHAIETVVKKLKHEALGTGLNLPLTPTVPSPMLRQRLSGSDRRRPLPPPPPPSHPPPPSPISSPLPPSTPTSSTHEGDLSRVPDYIPDELRDFTGRHRLSSSTAAQSIPNYCPPEYSVVEDTEGKGYQRLNHGQHSSFRHSHSPAEPAPPPEGYGRLQCSPRGSPVPRHSTSSQNSRSLSASPAPEGEQPYGRLDHHLGGSPVPEPPPAQGQYGRLNRPSLTARSQRSPAPSPPSQRPRKRTSSEGSQHYSSLAKPAPPTTLSQQVGGALSEGYGQLEIQAVRPTPEEYGQLDRRPSPGSFSRPPPPSPPVLHSPADGSPQEDLYNKLRPGPLTAPTLTRHPSPPAPSSTSAGEDSYQRLSHVAGNRLAQAGDHSHTPSAQAGSRPSSIFDPYSSLSNTQMEELSRQQQGPPPATNFDTSDKTYSTTFEPSDKIYSTTFDPSSRKYITTFDPSDSDYSALNPPPAPAMATVSVPKDVDSSGYCRPWTSFNLTPSVPQPTAVDQHFEGLYDPLVRGVVVKGEPVKGRHPAVKQAPQAPKPPPPPKPKPYVKKT